VERRESGLELHSDTEVRKAVFCCYLLSGRELRSTRRLDLDLGLVSVALSGVGSLSGSRLIEAIRRATIKFRGKESAI
jgi:hypothetical protein